MYLRDLAIVAYILGFERSSLPAFTAVHRLRKRMLEKRSAIQATRRIRPRKMASWFSYHPAALDVDG
jgi:hypothetical protein